MQNEIEITSGAAVRAKSRIPVTCPSGATYLMRRPNLSDAIQSGVLPENFVSKTLEELAKPNEGTPVQFNDALILKSENMMKWLITAAMLNPVIVPKAVTDDEIEFYDIPPDDRTHLFLWVKGELPDVLLATESGETTVGAVETFPDGEGGDEPSGVLDNSEGGGQEPIELSGATA